MLPYAEATAILKGPSMSPSHDRAHEVRNEGAGRRKRLGEEGKLTNKNNGVLYEPLSGLAIHHVSLTWGCKTSGRSKFVWKRFIQPVLDAGCCHVQSAHLEGSELCPSYLG